MTVKRLTKRSSSKYSNTRKAIRIKFKVPAAEQAEVKAIVQSTYGDIVIGKS